MTRSVGEIDNICRKSSYKIDKSHGATYMFPDARLLLLGQSPSVQLEPEQLDSLLEAGGE